MSISIKTKSVVLYDENGDSHNAVAIEKFRDVTSLASETHEFVPVSVEYRLVSDGSSLNFVDDNTFETILGGQLLYRTCPRKPPK